MHFHDDDDDEEFFYGDIKFLFRRRFEGRVMNEEIKALPLSLK